MTSDKRCVPVVPHSFRRLPVRKPVLSLALVVAAMVGLRSFGGDGLPFDRRRVTGVRFRYSYEDTTEVVVDDYDQVQRILATLRIEPGFKCLCVHFAEVHLTLDGEDETASVCGHCFDFRGRYHGYFRMPPGFRDVMVAYRDSTRLRRPLPGLK